VEPFALEHRSQTDGDSSLFVSGKEGMIVQSLRFLDLEMPVEFLTSWITPVPHSSCATTCMSRARWWMWRNGA
jgi:hypothetical protein